MMESRPTCPQTPRKTLFHPTHGRLHVNDSTLPSARTATPYGCVSTRRPTHASLRPVLFVSQGNELGASTHDLSTLPANQHPPCFCGPTVSGSPHFGTAAQLLRLREPKNVALGPLNAGMPRTWYEQQHLKILRVKLAIAKNHGGTHSPSPRAAASACPAVDSRSRSIASRTANVS
jgi:hypothetical protein